MWLYLEEKNPLSFNITAWNLQTRLHNLLIQTKRWWMPSLDMGVEVIATLNLAPLAKSKVDSETEVVSRYSMPTHRGNNTETTEPSMEEIIKERQALNILGQSKIEINLIGRSFYFVRKRKQQKKENKFK
eukprot:m.12327 g.12327  ORF g.12327 m.12327 type:complete len:130 (+) comp3984_c0_seq1:2712-3101(+)